MQMDQARFLPIYHAPDPAPAEGYVDCCGYCAVIPKASVVVVLRCSDTASAVAVRSHCGTVSAVVVHSRSP
jgi:hypothetical protein